MLKGFKNHALRQKCHAMSSRQRKTIIVIKFLFFLAHEIIITSGKFLNAETSETKM